MRPKSNVLAATCAAIAMSMIGCAEVQKAPVGTAAGAGVGALAGLALADSGAGLLIGGLIGGTVGNLVGREIEDTDRSKMGEALDSGRPTTIRDEEDGVILRVVPLDRLDYYAGYEGPCREFLLEAETPVGYDEGYGVACKTDGDWRIVSEPGEVARRPRR